MTEAPQAPTGDAPTTPQESGTFTQEDVNKIVGNRAQEAKQSAINDLLSKAEADSIDDVLEGYQTYRMLQQESETEAERLQGELQKLQPKAERANTLEEFVTNYVESQKEGLPNHLTALLNNMDPLQQAQWLQEHKAELEQPETPQQVRRSPDASRQQVNGDDPAQVQAQFLNQLLGGP